MTDKDVCDKCHHVYYLHGVSSKHLDPCECCESDSKKQIYSTEELVEEFSVTKPGFKEAWKKLLADKGYSNSVESNSD